MALIKINNANSRRGADESAAQIIGDILLDQADFMIERYRQYPEIIRKNRK